MFCLGKKEDCVDILKDNITNVALGHQGVFQRDNDAKAYIQIGPNILKVTK